MDAGDADRSAAAQCADQMDFIGFPQRLIERPDFTLIDEYADMRADVILFVDHAKPHARMRALEIGEQFGNRRTVRRHPGGAPRV